MNEELHDVILMRILVELNDTLVWYNVWFLWVEWNDVVGDGFLHYVRCSQVISSARCHGMGATTKVTCFASSLFDWAEIDINDDSNINLLIEALIIHEVSCTGTVLLNIIPWICEATGGHWNKEKRTRTAWSWRSHFFFTLELVLGFAPFLKNGAPLPCVQFVRI